MPWLKALKDLGALQIPGDTPYSLPFEEGTIFALQDTAVVQQLIAVGAVEYWQQGTLG